MNRLRWLSAEAIWSVHFLECGCYFSGVAFIFEALDFTRRCMLMLGFGWFLSRHISQLFIYPSGVDETAVSACLSVSIAMLFVCRVCHTIIEIVCNCLMDVFFNSLSFLTSNTFSASHSWSFLLQGLGTNTGLCYGSYVTPLGHGMNLVQTDSLPNTQVLVPGSPPIAAQSSSSSTSSTSTSSSSSSSQKLQWLDKLEVFYFFKCSSAKRQNPS